MILQIVYYASIFTTVWAVMWTTQFAQLMSLRESAFTEPNDKQRWYIAFLTVFLVAPVAFFIWKTLLLETSSAGAKSDSASDEVRT